MLAAGSKSWHRSEVVENGSAEGLCRMCHLEDPLRSSIRIPRGVERSRHPCRIVLERLRADSHSWNLCQPNHHRVEVDNRNSSLDFPRRTTAVRRESCCQNRSAPVGSCKCQSREVDRSYRAMLGVCRCQNLCCRALDNCKRHRPLLIRLLVSCSTCRWSHCNVRNRVSLD